MSEMHRPIVPKEDADLSAFTRSIEPPVLPPDSVVMNPLDWVRRFVAANPFYLASVVVLLYGIYRVSSDTGFLRIEVQQLFFNFTAIQLYEMALVGLAVILARRLVWYDSTLLVLLENLVIIVPFILVTQASLIDQRWIWGFCAAGAGLAVARVGTLKRSLRELNFPWRMLAIGGVLLLVNAILPIIYRDLQEERMATTITSGPAYYMNEWSWLAILPLLIACTNLLSVPRATGPLWPQRRWMPFAVLAAWLVASGVHLYALSYVYTFRMRVALWAPTLVVLAWTLRHWWPVFVKGPASWLRMGLLVAPFPLAFLALWSKDVGLASGLLLLNAGLYGLAFRQGDHRKLAGQLALASGIAALACTPATRSVPFLPSQPEGCDLGLALIGFLLITSLLSRRPGPGMLGALAAGVAIGGMIPVLEGGFHFAFHGALMFLLLHSFRWRDEVEPSARALRWATAVFWVLHAFIWMATGGPGGQVAVIGVGVLLTWWMVWWLRGVQPPAVIAGSAALLALSGPIVHGCVWLIAAPAGPLAVVASFVLLGLGTVVALTKHRWGAISED